MFHPVIIQRWNSISWLKFASVRLKSVTGCSSAVVNCFSPHFSIGILVWRRRRAVQVRPVEKLQLVGDEVGLVAEHFGPRGSFLQLGQASVYLVNRLLHVLGGFVRQVAEPGESRAQFLLDLWQQIVISQSIFIWLLVSAVSGYNRYLNLR